MKTHWFLCFGRPLNTYHPPEISHVREPVKCDSWKTDPSLSNLGTGLAYVPAAFFTRCINFPGGANLSGAPQGVFNLLDRGNSKVKGGSEFGCENRNDPAWDFFFQNERYGKWEFGEFGVGLGLVLMMMMMMMMMMFY